MEVAELVLKYVEALAWPLVTVGLVWGLRNHIQGAFTRMTRVETPAGAIEFATDAREVREDAEELAGTPETAEQAGTHQTEQESRFGVFQEAWDMAEASPIGALISAWLVLESISDQALAKLGGMPQSVWNVPRQPPASKIIEALTTFGLSPRAVSVFHDLRQLRNRAMHGVDTVTPAAARDFVETARYVAREIYSLPAR
ncbi:hypothetical protein [Streptomyces sp. uw30]|uniref:hypothetical protein n=1 Tax=Streptomyces sp. uw30 TaxID=1828179 RepID=UPI0011CD8969|nr:hypothetical protein [Streptomyces sp. uw30]